MFARESRRSSTRFICQQCFHQRHHTQRSRHSDRARRGIPLQPSPPASSLARHAHTQQHPKKHRAAKLTNRRLISIHGQDAPGFLQGITTNSIRTDQGTGIYSAFLTAQGRVLNDVFIYPTNYSSAYLDTLPGTVSRTDPGYLIEVDADEASKLFTHIKRFKLRAKVNLKLLDEGEWNTWSVWNGDGSTLLESEESSNHTPATDHKRGADGASGVGIGCLDSRAPGMGRREILPRDTRPDVLQDPDHGGEEASLKAYTIRRMLKGVAEGQKEIWRETALPQESNIDYMGGIDYRKGCYVGQELTIRTHHTGVVRKRILPCQLYIPGEEEPGELVYLGDDPIGTSTAVSPSTSGDVGKDIPPQPAPGTDITTSTSSSTSSESRVRKTGKWLHGIGNVGLALCRLDAMTDTKLPAGTLLWKPGMQFSCSWVDQHGARQGPVNVKAFVPGWFRRGGGGGGGGGGR